MFCLTFASDVQQKTKKVCHENQNDACMNITLVQNIVIKKYERESKKHNKL